MASYGYSTVGVLHWAGPPSRFVTAEERARGQVLKGAGLLPSSGELINR